VEVPLRRIEVESVDDSGLGADFETPARVVLEVVLEALKSPGAARDERPATLSPCRSRGSH
jgi:hypothetical protein